MTMTSSSVEDSAEVMQLAGVCSNISVALALHRAGESRKPESADRIQMYMRGLEVLGHRIKSVQTGMHYDGPVLKQLSSMKPEVERFMERPYTAFEEDDLNRFEGFFSRAGEDFGTIADEYRNREYDPQGTIMQLA